MSDSETLLSDLCLKRTCLDASYTALLNDLENLDHCVKDIDDPLVAFTMMERYSGWLAAHGLPCTASIVR